MRGRFIDNIDQNLKILPIDMGCAEYWPPLQGIEIQGTTREELPCTKSLSRAAQPCTALNHNIELHCTALNHPLEQAATIDVTL